MSTAVKEHEALRELLQVQPPSELRDWFSALIYGDSGVGKTTLLGTAQDHPGTCPSLIFDIEAGTVTLRLRHDIDVVRIKTKKQLETKFNNLFNSIDAEGRLPYYKTVCIDPVNELCSVDIKDIMKETYGAKPDTTDIDVPSPREWGKTGNHIRQIVRAFKELPCNTIFTAVADTESEEGKPTKIFPKFHGKTSRLRSEIPGMPDIVGYMYVEISPNGREITRKIQFAKTNTIVAKDRFDVLGRTMINPTIPKIYDLIVNGPATPKETE